MRTLEPSFPFPFLSLPPPPIPVDQETTSLQTPTNKAYRVVLTGGPCSGKTSSLAHVRAACKQAGYDCLVVPEVPTILMEGGATYPGLEGGHRLIAFEAALIRLQLQMEESFLTIARSLGKPTVILMDRGSVDICAYLMPKDWLATLGALGGLTTADLLVRYDQVIHLVTAADGAPSFYTLRYVFLGMLICVCMRIFPPDIVSSSPLPRSSDKEP